tara:strand:- start:250 stop:582 length:333 start_codon:yes stop_codon:yes gene_type:complete
MATYFDGMIQGTTATVSSAGTSVAPAAPIPDNCHSVIIFNESSSNVIYVKPQASAGVGLDAASSVHIPKETSITLSIGVKSVRANNTPLCYDCSAGSAIARITYVCGIGS